MSRDALRGLVGGMLALLVLAFFFVLVRSLSAGGDAAGADHISDIASGTTEMRRVNQQRVWVSRISPEQRKQLLSRAINPNAGPAACDFYIDFCMVSAATARSGIEIRYVRERPASVSRDEIWVGGFIDPNNGNLFDLLGRSYGIHSPMPRLVLEQP